MAELSNTMNGRDNDPENRKVIERQARRREFRDALRTYYLEVPTDERFQELLERLDQAELKK
jgi:hypothetical protein